MEPRWFWCQWPHITSNLMVRLSLGVLLGRLFQGWFLWAPCLQELLHRGEVELGLWWQSWGAFLLGSHGRGNVFYCQTWHHFLRGWVSAFKEWALQVHCPKWHPHFFYLQLSCLHRWFHAQTSIVSTVRINHILFEKKIGICISKLLPILNIYSTKLGKIVVLFQIIPAPWALPQNVKLQNIWDWNLTPVLPCCEVSLMKNTLVWRKKIM